MPSKNQIRIPTKERWEVLQKYACECAYCSKELTMSTLCLDSNNNQLYPSCMRCKRRKGSMTIEQYRQHILYEHHRLQYLNSKYSLCRDFKLVADVTNKVIFNFEKYRQ